MAKKKAKANSKKKRKTAAKKTKKKTVKKKARRKAKTKPKKKPKTKAKPKKKTPKAKTPAKKKPKTKARPKPPKKPEIKKEAPEKPVKPKPRHDIRPPVRLVGHPTEVIVFGTSIPEPKIRTAAIEAYRKRLYDTDDVHTSDFFSGGSHDNLMVKIALLDRIQEMVKLLYPEVRVERKNKITLIVD